MMRPSGPSKLKLAHSVAGKAYLLVSDGAVRVNGITGTKGDGFAISDEDTIHIKAEEDAEILAIDVPSKRGAR